MGSSAPRTGTPAVALALEVAAFIGKPFLRGRSALSEATWPARPSVAGSASVACSAKWLLHP
eukprot:589487-Pyramimonas_sp.AAC.1